MYINGYKNQEKSVLKATKTIKMCIIRYIRGKIFCYLANVVVCGFFVAEMEARELLGKRILFLRKQQGMTQNDLAFKSGLGREYISTVECGKRNISIDAIEKISFALELPLKELFDFEESRKNDSTTNRAF